MKLFRKLSSKKRISSRTRHLLKTISWRLVGSLDTLLIALFFTKDTTESEHKAITIVLLDTFVKMALYYIHERIWYRISFGIKDGKTENKRHIAKAISWRVLGTVATLILATAVTGDWQTGANIASVEVITKLILYYFHEKLWVRINVSLNYEEK